MSTFRGDTGMASNNLAPIGFSFARNFLSSAATYAQQQMTIANAYGTALMMGDPVIINSSGFVAAVASQTNVAFLGIFAGVLPYYDTNLQGISHGLNGAYITSAAPVTGTNISCLVITDPFATFYVQTNYAGAFQQSWVGTNCAWLQASVGNLGTYGNIAGRSGAYIDANVTGFTTTNTLPLRVLGPAGVTGGPNDPANNNPWIEVRMNQPAALAPLGI